MKPDAGLSLGNRYRLVSRIAVGGMGEVWVAHDESLARDVAVKVLREEFAGDEGFLERFRTEARNSAQLSHPNIAQLYDYGEQDGSGFLVMELILGEPMLDLLDREPVLPTRRLLPILASTARALHAAHVAGVVHRDVKPGNILLARSGRVKITDFGISTATNQIPMTDSGMVMGTAQYLSPEQAIGRAATPASDIYSLGIVAYEALVGHRPFTGPTAVDIAVAHVNTKVPPMPAEIDPELRDLVMRMLAKDPEERPRSAASLARVLDAMNDRTPTGGIELGRPSRAVDAVDALDSSSTGGLAMPTLAEPATPGPRPTGQPATLVPGRDPDESSAQLPAAAPPSYAPGRSTGTGQRWGQLSRPLIVLILMVLFALLGAAFADRLWGPPRAAPGPAHGVESQIVIMATAGAQHGRGIIDPSQWVDWRTTTARDL
jgi:eukaryotic-like serine/threonine-protein kinase